MRIRFLFYVVAAAAALATQPVQARVIKIYTHNGPSRKLVAVASVGLNVADTTLSLGSTLRLTEGVLPANASNKAVLWTSSDSAVATVVNGVVATRDTGVATLTVTTQSGSKTATCHLRVCHLAVDGICWADANVDAYQTFAARPDLHTTLYQWNRSKAWSAADPTDAAPPTGWETDITDTAWTINPCPTGWRLPTRGEYVAVNGAGGEFGGKGGSWAAADARGNAVGGRFYGTAHDTCALPHKMAGCIFFPASGYRQDETSELRGQETLGVSWSSTQQNYENGYQLNFLRQNSFPELYTHKAQGLSVRCVRSK